MKIEELSFTAMRDGKELPAFVPGQYGRCFWNVKSTGKCAADERIGRALALEYIDFCKQNRGSGTLNKIVLDFPNPLTQVEISFLMTVELELTCGAGGARRTLDYWARCMEQEKRKEMLRKSAKEPEAVPPARRAGGQATSALGRAKAIECRVRAKVEAEERAC